MSVRDPLHRELSRVRRRRVAFRAGGVAAAFWRPAPEPPPAPERAVAAPAFQVVRTSDVGLELAGDAELLGTSRTAAIVGHPGGPRRLIVAP